MYDRKFDHHRGDRVARQLNNPEAPATSFEESFEYARRRAERLGSRVSLRRHRPGSTPSTRRWWVVIVQN